MKEQKTGLTLIEMMIVIGILAILFSLGAIVFNSFVKGDQIDSGVKKVISCLNEARAKTLAGYSLGGESALNFGVHFEENAYTLFGGSVFDSQDQTNQRFSLDEGLIFNQIELSSGNIIFEKITGQVVGFDGDQNFVILKSRDSSQERRVTINKLGTIE